jgi:hypothetical protein
MSTTAKCGLPEVLAFITIASKIKNEILLVQDSGHDISKAPNHLSPSLIEFLASSCSLNVAQIPDLWHEHKDLIWKHDPLISEVTSPKGIENIFREHGHQYGFCTNPILLSIYLV